MCSDLYVGFYYNIFTGTLHGGLGAANSHGIKS